MPPPMRSLNYKTEPNGRVNHYFWMQYCHFHCPLYYAYHRPDFLSLGLACRSSLHYLFWWYYREDPISRRRIRRDHLNLSSNWFCFIQHFLRIHYFLLRHFLSYLIHLQLKDWACSFSILATLTHLAGIIAALSGSGSRQYPFIPSSYDQSLQVLLL